MITWVSERSGIASTGMFRTAQTAPTIATPVRMRTRNWSLALSSMIRSTIARAAPSSVRVAARRRTAERRERRSEARLRVDQEVGGRHDPLTGLEPPQHLVVALRLAAELDRARLEPPFANHDEDDLVLPGVEHGVL